MFLVISGTKEAKDIANLCKGKGWDVLILAVAKYGPMKM
jgi:precorrin-6x reductase